MSELSYAAVQPAGVPRKLENGLKQENALSEVKCKTDRSTEKQ